MAGKFLSVVLNNKHTEQCQELEVRDHHVVSSLCDSTHASVLDYYYAVGLNLTASKLPLLVCNSFWRSVSYLPCSGTRVLLRAQGVISCAQVQEI